MKRSTLIIASCALAIISATSTHAQVSIPMTKAVAIGQDVMNAPRGWTSWGWFIEGCHPAKKEFTLRWRGGEGRLHIAEGDSFVVSNSLAIVKLVKFGSECNGSFEIQYQVK